jgi:hypothetical protein
MTDLQFTVGQRVFHRQLGRYGTYAGRDDLDRASSYVDFGDDPDLCDDILRVTTAQLVPTDEVTA